jgi:hypothetical protein
LGTEARVSSDLGFAAGARPRRAIGPGSLGKCGVFGPGGPRKRGAFGLGSFRERGAFDAEQLHRFGAECQTHLAIIGFGQLANFKILVEATDRREHGSSLVRGAACGRRRHARFCADSPQWSDQESDRDCRDRESDARRGGLWQRPTRFERSQSEFDGFAG